MPVSINDNPRLQQYLERTVRPLARRLCLVYDEALAAVADFESGDMASLINNLSDPNEFIQNSRVAEGVPDVSAPGLYLVVQNLKELAAYVEQVPPGQPMSLIAGARAIAPGYTGGTI